MAKQRLTKEHKARVGRPRSSKRPIVESAREDVLRAAATLFSKQGYSATSTRQIAEAIGIKQPSLFSHFKKKEHILQELVHKSTERMFEALPKSDDETQSAAESLYLLMRCDFLFLMTEPYGIGGLLHLPELRNGPLADAVAQSRHQVIERYQRLIARGVKQGDFQTQDLTVATHTVFGMGESLWSWYSHDPTRSPEKIAEQIADLAMHALKIDARKLDAIKLRYGAD